MPLDSRSTITHSGSGTAEIGEGMPNMNVPQITALISTSVVVGFEESNNPNNVPEFMVFEYLKLMSKGGLYPACHKQHMIEDNTTLRQTGISGPDRSKHKPLSEISHTHTPITNPQEHKYMGLTIRALAGLSTQLTASGNMLSWP